jgi:hypothetical protein
MLETSRDLSCTTITLCALRVMQARPRYRDPRDDEAQRTWTGNSVVVGRDADEGPVHGELLFRLQLEVQTTHSNGFASSNSQGWLPGLLEHRLSHQVCRRIDLDARDARCSSF